MDKAIELSIVIPFYNERDNLPILIKRISTSINAITGNIELILVNDGSTDNFSDCIKEEKSDRICIKLINLSKNYGSHAAMRAGIQHSSGKYIILQAADLQDPPELIVNLYEKGNEGFDIVWAEREVLKEEQLKILFQFYTDHLSVSLLQVIILKKDLMWSYLVKISKISLTIILKNIHQFICKY